MNQIFVLLQHDGYEMFGKPMTFTWLPDAVKYATDQLQAEWEQSRATAPSWGLKNPEIPPVHIGGQDNVTYITLEGAYRSFVIHTTELHHSEDDTHEREYLLDHPEAVDLPDMDQDFSYPEEPADLAYDLDVPRTDLATRHAMAGRYIGVDNYPWRTNKKSGRHTKRVIVRGIRKTNRRAARAELSKIHML